MSVIDHPNQGEQIAVHTNFDYEAASFAARGIISHIGEQYGCNPHELTALRIAIGPVFEEVYLRGANTDPDALEVAYVSAVSWIRESRLAGRPVVESQE